MPLFPIRYLPLLEILQNCNFLAGLESKIEFCIDCTLSIILDRASEDLEIIRSERKRNTEILDSMLKEVASQIFQAGGIDRPLITKRRSRMCVGIRASHRYLLPGGVVLNVSSSGATYFMEPKDAIDLNNLEVRLSSSEKAEESAILSMLASEIANSESDISNLLDKIMEIDLAFARAAYAQWMNGVCPIFRLDCFEGCDSNVDSDILDPQEDDSLNVNIVGIQHPLLLESSLEIISDNLALRSGNAVKFGDGNGEMATKYTSHSISDFPVPVDFKIGRGTRVVVISGPNTGGKTASMKTLGLASLMSKAGMYLPAKNNPKLPWFDLILADIGDHQIHGEAEDLDRREKELILKETQQVQQELVDAKSQMESLIQKFEKQLRNSGRDKLNSLIKETESAIASIVKAHTLADHFNEADQTSYTPQIGEQVRVKGLGGKLATVVESLGDDETILVQYGKVKVRVKRSNIVAIPSNAKNVVTSSSIHQGRQSRRNGEYRVNVDNKSDDDISYGPVVQTSKNTVDLRGMRVEEASIHLEMTINSSRPYSVLFVIHGTGTGAVKECALEILQNHPRITNHEPESPMNYGCTIAYVK